MHQIRFRLGLRPRYPILDTLAGFKGGASRQGEGRDWEREGREMTGQDEEGRREGRARERMQEGRRQVTEGIGGTGHGMGRGWKGKEEG